MVNSRDLPADLLFIVFRLLSSEPDLSILTTTATTRTWQQARCSQASVLLNVSLVNRNWHSVAQPLIDKTIDLTLSERNQARNLFVLERLQHQAQLRARVKHLRIRDVYTQQRVPLGIANLDWICTDDDLLSREGDEPDFPSCEREYFVTDYVTARLPEPALQRQIAKLRQSLSCGAVQSFEWAAVSPISSCLVDILTTMDIDVHIKLNPHAVETAAWSWTPVVNHAMLRCLEPIAGKLRSLHLCMPTAYGPLGEMIEPIKDFLRSCPRLEDLQLRSLGRPCQPRWHGPDSHRSLWQESQDGLKGANGPPSTLASQAQLADYPDWRTGYHRPQRNYGLEFLCQGPESILSLSTNLTSLTLRNLCLCGKDGRDGEVTSEMRIRLPALRHLTLSCLRFLNLMDKRPEHLQTLGLFLGVDWMTERRWAAWLPFSAAHCSIHWRQDEITDALISLPSLVELSVYGHEDALSALALLHHGKSLRKLILLHGREYDCAAANDARHRRVPKRMTRLIEFLGILSDACPKLKDFSCDAPNASTEFDAFLNVLVKDFSHLRSLSIRRSLEPYGDTYPATKLSYARFTKASVALIWSMLSVNLRLQELKITIGRLSSWDDEGRPTKIAPNVDSRTFVVQRALDRIDLGRSVAVDHIVYLEEDEALLAISQGRPAQLVGYWQKQADLAAEFAEERNEPLYPGELLVRRWIGDGPQSFPPLPQRSHPLRTLGWHGWDSDSSSSDEDDYRCGNPYRTRSGQLLLKRAEMAVQKALPAQHAAQMSEVARPTRKYY